jgi:DNA modification methylase
LDRNTLGVVFELITSGGQCLYALPRIVGVEEQDMPAEIKRKRAGSHPAPFPELLPARLIKLFTFGAIPHLETDTSGIARGFAGEIVVDPFCGTGTTCVAAKRMGRRWIGIDRVKSYATAARIAVERADLDGGVSLRRGRLVRGRLVRGCGRRRRG